MNTLFKIAAMLLLAGATAQPLSAMTPIPDKEINGYIIRSRGELANLIPNELNTFLLGKVYTGSPQDLASRQLKIVDLLPNDQHTLLLINVLDNDKRDAVQTYAVTMYSPAPGEWKFIDGALIKQEGDINVFVNELKTPRRYDDVVPANHEVHAELTAINVTRSFDIKIFLADVGMQTYSNDVTFNYLIDDKTKVLCMADTNSSGSIHNPGGPAMTNGDPPIPSSTISLGADVPRNALELLQVMCGPVSDNTRAARWFKLATSLGNTTCHDPMMAQTAAILLRQVPEQFVKAVDPTDAAAKKFIGMALAQDPTLKDAFKAAIKRAPRAKSKAWKRLL